MKQFLILLIFALFIALGIGVYYSWPQIEPNFAEIYSGSPDQEYFEEEVEEVDVDPVEEEEVYQFENEETADNYLALAKKSISSSPRQSWDYLERALEKDPANQTIRIYRARMLEGVGKPSLAEEEYELAYAEDPENLPFADQYAGFLMRRGNYEGAQALLNQNLNPPTSDSIWLKAWFLGKVYKPTLFDWKRHRIPTGHTKSLVQYVLQLPENQFWDKTTYAKVPYRHDYSENQQITFWLRLFQALESEDYPLALQLLEGNSFQQESWNPQLVINLTRVLNYKLNRTLSLDKRTPIFARLKKSAQQKTPLTHLLSELAEKEEMMPNSAVPNDVRPLMLSDEIFTIVLLDAKWMEGAIELHRIDRYPTSFPKNLAYDFAVALKESRGALAALKFAEMQESTPEMNLLIAEIRLEKGDNNLAVNQLHHLSKESGDIGLKASQLIAQMYMKQNEYERARNFIEGSSHLQTDVSGQELLAQIFQEQNQPELAHRIYLTIEDQSPQAKSFLAYKAMKGENWERAEELTMQLVGEFPENKVYRRNLEIIRENRQEN